MKKILLAAIINILPFSIVVAQEQKLEKEQQEMNVDFPDETEETDLVAKGELQLETAFLFNSYKNSKKSYIGQGLLRYGVSHRLELRMLVEDGRNRDQYLTETVQSTYPLAIGTKVSVIKDVTALPDISLVGYVKLPFTSKAKQQTKYWSPLLLAAFQNKWGKKWKLEYNWGIQQEPYSAHWLWTGNASLHYKITEPLEVFAEYYAQYDNAASPQHNVGGGLAYQINNNLEVYMAGGSTVYYEESNYFVNGGFAIRLPDNK